MFGVKKRVLAAGLFIIAMFLIWLFLKDVVTLEVLQSKQMDLKGFVDTNYLFALLIFTAAYTVSAATAFPLGGILVLLAGFLFGAVVGTLATVFGATFGGAFIFLTARYGFKEWVESHYGKYLAPIEKELCEHPASYMLFLRFMPVVPYIVINVVPALVNVRFRTFLWTSVIGLLPGSIVFAVAGQELSRIASTGDIMTPSLVFALFLLGGLSLVPLVYRKYRKYKTKDS